MSGLNAVTITHPGDGLHGHVKTYPFGLVPSWVACWAPCYRTQVWATPAQGSGPTQGHVYGGVS